MTIAFDDGIVFYAVGTNSVVATFRINEDGVAA